jgi:biopolymer transport protein ExbD
MNWIVLLDVIVLALMLVCVVVVVTRIFYRYHSARPAGDTDGASRGKLSAILSIELGGLKAIASTAPYLGLAGTCVGLMSQSGFTGEMDEHTLQAMMAARMAATLTTTAAGILVAVPAICAYNYLCTRRDSLENEVPNQPDRISGYRQGTRRLALTKRFSLLPAFGLIAAPGLAVLVAVYTPYFAPREATGLELKLAPSCCENCANDRITLLHITDAGKLLLNEEQEDWNGLAGRLSEIYSVREQRTLDLVADDGVPFQTVADALDIVENIPATTGSQATGIEMDKLDITVRLITPNVWNARCLEPVATSSGHHVSK